MINGICSLLSSRAMNGLSITYFIKVLTVMRKTLRDCKFDEQNVCSMVFANPLDLRSRKLGEDCSLILSAPLGERFSSVFAMKSRWRILSSQICTEVS